MKFFKYLVLASLVFSNLHASQACNPKDLYKRVDHLIDNEPALDDDIHIRVIDCNVALYGKVDSQYELDLAKKVIKQVTGINNLYFTVKVEKDSLLNSKYEMTSVEARP